MFHSVQRAVVALSCQIDQSVGILESETPQQRGPLWSGIVARRRRAAMMLRMSLSPRDRQIARMQARGLIPRKDPASVSGSDIALIAQFDAALALPNLPDHLRTMLRDLRSEVEQSRFVMGMSGAAKLS